MRSECLKIMDSGEPFGLAYVTADRRRGTGGKVVEVENWVKVSTVPEVSAADAEAAAGKDVPVTPTRKPNHRLHGTINIANPGNKYVHIHKVHVALILTFNGKKVTNG